MTAISSLIIAMSMSALAMEIPSPISSKYAVPNPNPAFNENDQSYLCSLMQLSETQCGQAHFFTSLAGIYGDQGIVQYAVDVRIKYLEKQCVAAVWKTYQHVNQIWVLSEPTKLLNFPYSCDFK